ncbi:MULTISPECIES: multidrug effflux MFS transporter [unclassified Saccharibacter]|uniref:multidrug effflux MFS transporter n=1 Tax=unclassified Saccharibacter TaxID=2648722 RepID=UPI001320A7EA|nr:MULTISPECIES: multidrug effflux MFS transporter [unclassified Saccharibacter]MXV36895.1 Bcr/CflA family efflux MFS transporter [Saccharibacter sp. EH611]MXV58615.1 Bcr/CflA family efflux MFS transporter [Saccharibacter sp. EH70]MXV66121.1 Bcr/CflA family efflux MFS transporter [Saccharibacter sp. EH60]
MTSPSSALSWRLLAVLSLLMGFAAISTDFYLPAMPAMARSLHASPEALALTISGFLAGFSVGQLFWGPIGDRFGRRIPIACGLVLFIIGSLGCALSSSITIMIGWRVVQAIGACASVVLARAMVRDLYEGSRATAMMSHLMTITAATPLLAPTVGGQILVFGGWRSIFTVLTVIGVLIFGLLFTLPETFPPERRHHEPLARVFAHYKDLLLQPRLIGYAGAGGCLYAGMFAYISGSPAAYINYYHVSPSYYGLLFGLNIVGIMGANAINARLAHRLGSDRLLTLGGGLAILSALVLAVTGGIGWGGLWGLAIPLFFYTATSGFIVANSLTGALHQHPRHAGAVSALVGAVHYGSGILGSALVGVFADGTPRPMTAIILGFSLLSVFFLLLLKAPQKMT